MTPTQLLGACILIVLFSAAIYAMIYAYGLKETIVAVLFGFGFVGIMLTGILLVLGKIPL